MNQLIIIICLFVCLCLLLSSIGGYYYYYKKTNTTNPITTNPITTNPITTNPITTNPITTNSITTNPITTNPITTNPNKLENFDELQVNNLTGNKGYIYNFKAGMINTNDLEVKNNIIGDTGKFNKLEIDNLLMNNIDVSSINKNIVVSTDGKIKVNNIDVNNNVVVNNQINSKIGTYQELYAERSKINNLISPNGEIIELTTTNIKNIGDISSTSINADVIKFKISLSAGDNPVIDKDGNISTKNIFVKDKLILDDKASIVGNMTYDNMNINNLNVNNTINNKGVIRSNMAAFDNINIGSGNFTVDNLGNVKVANKYDITKDGEIKGNKSSFTTSIDAPDVYYSSLIPKNDGIFINNNINFKYGNIVINQIPRVTMKYPIHGSWFRNNIIEGIAGKIILSCIFDETNDRHAYKLSLSCYNNNTNNFIHYNQLQTTEKFYKSAAELYKIKTVIFTQKLPICIIDIWGVEYLGSTNLLTYHNASILCMYDNGTESNILNQTDFGKTGPSPNNIIDNFFKSDNILRGFISKTMSTSS